MYNLVTCIKITVQSYTQDVETIHQEVMNMYMNIVHNV
jgi:hypothetical protein